MDEKCLMRFQSETFVLKFPRRSVDGVEAVGGEVERSTPSSSLHYQLLVKRLKSIFECDKNLGRLQFYENVRLSRIDYSSPQLNFP